MSGPAAADLFLSLAAVAGLAVLGAVLRSRDAADPLNRRLLFALAVAAVLFAGRAGLTLSGWGGFGTLVRLAAALIPLAVLIVTEGLLRRHAPAWAKILIGGGTLLAPVAALWRSGPGVDPDDLALMGFQIAGFAVAGWLVAARDRAGLSAAENRAAVRLAWSLVLLLPLGAVDFLGPLLGLPVQVAGLAVLALCWLAVSLGRAEAGPDDGTLPRLLVLGGAGAAATAALVAAGAPALAGAVVLAALLVSAVAADAMSLRAEERNLSLLRHLAEGPEEQGAFLRGLLAHPAIEGGALLMGADLADFDPAVLARAFAGGPVLRRGRTGGDAAADEQAALLAERYGATHLLWLSDDPPRLAVLAMPTLAAGARAELELAALARMARLTGVRDGQ